MGFREFLKHAGMMLLWWAGGFIGVIIGFFFLWKFLQSASTGNINWFFFVLAFIFGGLGGLAIIYGTKTHDQ